LEPILNKPLTVERIDNYADDAVNELIFLLNQKVDDYKSGHNTGGWDDKSIENAALRFYGLESVNSYLDFLAQKDAEIRSLNGVIKKAGQVGEVIVRPDSYNPNIVGGNGGEIKEKKMISRVKTVLFILKEDFEVDVSDESQLTLKKGILKDNMMRKTSYFLISAPKIDRTLLVCDEEGNASYVFNNKVLRDKGISEDILIGSTKEELNELIQKAPESGKRVVYSKDGFVPRMIVAIKNPNSKKPDEITKEMGGMGKYLYPKAEKDELSCNKLAEKLGIVHSAVLGKLIDQIDPEELGEVNLRKFGSSTTQAYTPEQQTLIIKKAEDQGLLIPKAAENELSCSKLARKLGIDPATLSNLINQIDPEELGEVNLRKFGSNTTQAYTPEQQTLIIKKAEDQGLLIPKAVENELSCSKLARKLGLDPATLSNLINQIDPEELGEVSLKKHNTRSAQAYTIEQQWKIIEYIREHKKSLIGEEKRKWMESRTEE